MLSSVNKRFMTKGCLLQAKIMVARNSCTEIFMFYLDLMAQSFKDYIFCIDDADGDGPSLMAYQHIPTCHDDDDDDIGNIVKIRKKASQSCVLHLLYKASMFYRNCVREARVASSVGVGHLLIDHHGLLLANLVLNFIGHHHHHDHHHHHLHDHLLL